MLAVLQDYIIVAQLDLINNLCSSSGWLGVRSDLTSLAVSQLNPLSRPACPERHRPNIVPGLPILISSNVEDCLYEYQVIIIALACSRHSM